MVIDICDVYVIIIKNVFKIYFIYNLVQNDETESVLT